MNTRKAFTTFAENRGWTTAGYFTHLADEWAVMHDKEKKQWWIAGDETDWIPIQLSVYDGKVAGTAIMELHLNVGEHKQIEKIVNKSKGGEENGKFSRRS